MSHLPAGLPANAHVGDSADTIRHLHGFFQLAAPSTPHHQRAAAKAFTTCDFDSGGIFDRLHFARAVVVVVGGAHDPCQEMEPYTMAALAILAGIGVFCWLLYGAAIYALPFLVGAFVGPHAEQAGAGPFGGMVLGIGARALVLIVGRAVFAHARGVLRVAIALVFATPVALAGHSATSMLFGLAWTSEGWHEAFSILGAIAIAATLPPASDDNQRRPSQVWGQGAQHCAGEPRRRPRSV